VCGIAGFVERGRRADPEVLRRQLELLLHRGPDSSGVFADGCAAIGQTRLAIIDLVTGDPPIANEDGTVGVALNGEIYNFLDIRAELQTRGHAFSTHGDTEVIAHLAEDLEPADVALRLHGMFGFATWDTRRQRLVLGRDRFGKKPLYYWHDERVFVFGTEIKAVLAHPSVPSELDEEAIAPYLTFGYVPHPRTFYRGIRSVPPGHVLVLDEGAPPRLESYWEPRIPGQDGVERLDVDIDEAAAAVRAGLATAVTRRLVADVPLGAFLSGGIDSSAVVALMADATSAPVRTFTIGFEDQDGFDERPWARLVADRFGTDHTEFVVHPQAMDLVERLVWHHDQPFGDSSALPTYLLSELTAGHVTVALCGDGGDELFGGYERFAGGALVHSLRHVPRPALHAAALVARPLAAGALRSRVEKAQRFLDSVDHALPDAFRSWVTFVDDDRREALLSDGDHWGLADYRRRWDATAGAHVLDRLLLLTIQTYLVDDLLPKVDRMGMAHALEVRSPFLDHELAELALRLPPRTKVRGTSLKRVLKKAFEGVLPEEILTREKHGFGVPLDRWFREDLATYVDAMLGDPSARIRGHVRGDAVDAILAEHRRGTSLGHALWTLLTLEVFLRRQGW
jgi:asparagine synthase (glutamine-hydrolysing)